MIIDFHTHAFTDSIAEKAVSSLSKTSGISPLTDGTVTGLIDFMNGEGVDKSVILPVATKPSQQATINNWASSISDEHIISFGTLFPFSENILDEAERIKSLGLKGIKFHCEYQKFFPDDSAMFPVYQKLAELNLPVIFHGGWDPLSTDIIYGTPERFAKAVSDNPNLTFIIAHLGGMKMWDDVEKYLAGKFDNLYFDTSCLSRYISPEVFYKIIKIHTPEKILFGSDSPWDKPSDIMKMIDSSELSDCEKQKILCLNAKKLLNI